MEISTCLYNTNLFNSIKLNLHHLRGMPVPVKSESLQQSHGEERLFYYVNELHS